MAQYYTNFGEYESGRTPDDWLNAWVPGYQQLEIVDANDATGGKILRHVIESHDRRAWAWMRVPGSSHIDVLSRVRTDDAGARFGIAARGIATENRDSVEGITWELFNGTDRDESNFEATKQEYRRIAWLNTYDPTMEEHKGPKRPHGLGSVRGMGYFPWEPNNWYWLRLEARNLDGFIAVRTKVWDDNLEEPGVWTYDVQRTERESMGLEGWVGITGQLTSGRREYDVFAVGTDGDPAPRE